MICSDGCLNNSTTGQLGDHAVLHRAHAPTAVNKQISRRPVRYTDIDCDLFQHTLGEIHPPDIDVNNYEVAAELFTDTIYDCASNCKTSNVHTAPNHAVISDDRWENILNSNDDKLIWNSINWKCNIEEPEYEIPPDSNFQEHLETILNPEDGMQLDQDEYLSDVHIPVLNDPISPIEVEDVIHKQLKPNKGCGPDGIAPGLLRLLPIQWLLNLTILLNCVFFNAYPVKWTYAKLCMLFKKGDKTNCDNYRGISMINNVAKIYDYILCNRLTQWFTPDREQAQKKRGCIEHLVTLRLIINYCFRKKLQLHIAYIDFSKAYDRVPRNKFMDILKRLGCGCAMLLALIAMYKITKSILGLAVITAIVGVRQGSPTSCFLFTLYVNVLIRMLKDRCAPDGCLKWLHVLMLMDDTVILATSRERLIAKMYILDEFCESHGMIINECQTKFMVIHGGVRDRMQIKIGSRMIEHCDQYVYLGSIFTSDGSTKSSLCAQVDDRQKHYNKLVLFLRNNCDICLL